MKCFALFVLVALAAVAMAQEPSSVNPETGSVDPARAPEAREVKRDRRGFLAYSNPLYYGGYNSYLRGYNTYTTHYNAPYAYYRTYPHYGYGIYY